MVKMKKVKKLNCAFMEFLQKFMFLSKSNQITLDLKYSLILVFCYLTCGGPAGQVNHIMSSNLPWLPAPEVILEFPTTIVWLELEPPPPPMRFIIMHL